VTAVNEAATGPGGSRQALLDGFRAAIVVSLVAVLLGIGAGESSLAGQSSVFTSPIRG